MNAYYFGTSLSSSGHYVWDLYSNGIQNSRLDFNIFPFNPEKFPVVKDGHAPKGMTRFYNIGHWSICAIGGSRKDKRGGCKSIFIFDEHLNQERMIRLLKGIPFFNDLIKEMPFAVETFKEESKDHDSEL